MVRVRQTCKSKGVADYFFKYCAKDAIGVPRWMGKAAERLGLTGKNFSGIATEGVFRALAENTHPETGEPLTQRTVATRGNVLKGFDSLEKLGSVFELEEKECHRQLAWNYANVLEKGKEKAKETGQKYHRALKTSH